MLKEQKIPIVIDADGIKALLLDLECIRDHSLAILTPNRREFDLLLKKLDLVATEPLSHCVQEAARRCGVTILLKGAVDVISDGTELNLCNIPGGEKRCGGLGDLLAGMCGVLIYWFQREPLANVSLPSVAFIACALLKEATRLAFEKYGRGMTAPDVLAQIPFVIPRP